MKNRYDTEVDNLKLMVHDYLSVDGRSVLQLAVQSNIAQSQLTAWLNKDGSLGPRKLFDLFETMGYDLTIECTFK